jgi:hypothetical protein
MSKTFDNNIENTNLNNTINESLIKKGKKPIYSGPYFNITRRGYGRYIK